MLVLSTMVVAPGLKTTARNIHGFKFGLFESNVGLFQLRIGLAEAPFCIHGSDFGVFRSEFGIHGFIWGLVEADVGLFELRIGLFEPPRRIHGFLFDRFRAEFGIHGFRWGLVESNAGLFELRIGHADALAGVFGLEEPMKSIAFALALTVTAVQAAETVKLPNPAWHSSGCKGEEIKVLMGCPFDQASPFTMRVRLQKGLKIPSHSYPVDIGVTMLSGVLDISFNESGKVRTVRLARDDFFKVPAYAFHTAQVIEETELQDNGIGPVVVTWEHEKCAPTPAPDPLRAFCATDH